MGIHPNLSLRLNLLTAFCFLLICVVYAQNDDSTSLHIKKKENTFRIGTASFYSNKFVGRKTATGEIFSQKKMTAACNVFPLGTRVRVTNLKNNKSVVVKINDRMHSKNKRLIDLTTEAAEKLKFTRMGLTRVRIEKVRR